MQGRGMDLGEHRAGIMPFADAIAAGIGEHGLRRARGDGSRVAVRRGWTARAEEWSARTPEAREIARTLASMGSTRGSDVVVSHASAAAVWGFPLYRWGGSRVHVTCAGGRTAKTSAPVVRHRNELPEHEVTRLDGLSITTPLRTVFDALCAAPVEAAVCIADAWLRAEAWGDEARRYDLEHAERMRESLLRRLREAPGARGIRQARWVADFADGRAQLPGESVSRVQLHRLGFAPPRLQVPVPGPGSSMYWVDFGLDDVAAWGEFDGAGKLTDGRWTGGRDPAQILVAEKEREDWIRGVTGRPLLRWGMTHIRTPEDLGRRLAAFGIRPRRP